MAFFSTRNGYLNMQNKLKETSYTLKECIWTCFYKQEYDYYDTIEYANYTTEIEDMMIEMGIQYEFPRNSVTKSKNADKLYDYVVKSMVWFRIYDFIEKYLSIKDGSTADKMAKEFNRVLKEEVALYRVLDGLVVPIVNEGELESIKQ